MNSGCAVFASQSVSLCIRRSCFPQITNFTDSSFFYQMPSRVFCVFNFYNGNSTLKRWLVWYRYVQYFCYVGMTQHKQYLMQLCFQFQENCQRYLSSFIYDKSWSNELTILSALKSDSHLPKIVLLFPLLKSLQNWWKMFLFHLKSSFHSQDI